MITVERTSYGLRAVLTGTVTLAEARGYHAEVMRQLPGLGSEFSIMFDQRSAKAIGDSAIQKEITAPVLAVLAAGVARICIVSATSAATMQSQRMARGAGLTGVYHCVDGNDPNADQIAEAWVVDGRRLVGV